MKKKILTVPKENKNYKPYHLTGNHYIGIPLINPENTGIESVNLISMTSNSLIEFYGNEKCELFRPFLYVNGEQTDLRGKLSWRYLYNWIPEFKLNNGSVKIKGRIFAPIDIKGFVYEIDISNISDREMEIKSGLEGNWQSTKKTIYTQRLIRGTNDIYYDSWTDTIVIECNAGFGLGALAIGWNMEPESIFIGKGYNSDNYKEVREGTFVENNDRDFIKYIISNAFNLSAGEERKIRYFICGNIERDGARTSVVDMKRRDNNKIYTELINWLKEKSLDVGDEDLNRVMNKNLFFNYFYSLGKTIDTEEIVMITSRSPRYYVSAAYWPRDTFLWSYPAVLLIDKTMAKEVLLTGFKRHIKNAGIHSHYINGTVLYPGFELDQLCSYIIALKEYIEETNDYSILGEEIIVRGIREIYKELLKHKGEKVNLYETFLDPSDDQVTYPYLIYNNVLVYLVLNFLTEISSEYNILKDNNVKEKAEAVKKDIIKYGIVDYKDNKVFAWAVDGKGNYELYDNPPGSLMTLKHYGFVDEKNEIFENTVKWVNSEENPYYTFKGKLKGVGCIHAKGPWILGIANNILAGKKDYSKNLLKRISMDNGFACETIDCNTGIAKTGNAFATCGGFLAYSIYKGFGKDNNNSLEGD